MIKNAFKQLTERIFLSWETTLTALLCLVFLVAYWHDVDSLIKALGAIAIIVGLFYKKSIPTTKA